MTTYKNRLSYQTDKKQLIMDCSFILLILGAVLFALWKCKYGFGGYDEPFYQTIPHRLTQGDALFKHEWNLSLLSSFLLYPFTWLYTTITGGTTGILLAARYAYVFAHLAVSIAIYARLRRFGFTSVIASVLYFLFTPFNIMSLSYNSMGLDLITLTGVFLATADTSKKLPIILSGVFFAGAVLCQPYVLIAYALFIFCVLINIACKKLKFRNFFTGYYFSLKTFLYFTLGAGIMAVLFFIFLLPRTSLSEVFGNLQYMINDPMHPPMPLSTRLSYYFTTIWKCTELFKYSIIGFGLLLVAMLVDKKRFNHRGIYLALTSVVVLFAYYSLLTNLTKTNYNSIMFPILYLGIASYILTKNKNRALMAGLFLLSVVFSFACCIASNQYFYIVSCALVAANVASIIFIGLVIKEMLTEKETEEEKHILLFSFEKKKTTKSYFSSSKKLAGIIATIVMVLVILSQGCLQLIVKSTHVFWELEPQYLTTTLYGGPADGILTSEANAQNYQAALSDLQKNFSAIKNENVLFLSNNTWAYLATDMRYGTYSAWTQGGGLETAVSRLNQYYTLNPDKIPKYVYIPKADNPNLNIITSAFWGKDYKLTASKIAYILSK